MTLSFGSDPAMCLIPRRWWNRRCARGAAKVEPTARIVDLNSSAASRSLTSPSCAVSDTFSVIGRARLYLHHDGDAFHRRGIMPHQR
jgi:hypothetical protein